MPASPGVSEATSVPTRSGTATAGHSAPISKALVAEVLKSNARRRWRRWFAVRLAQLGAAVVVISAWEAAATVQGNSFFPQPSEVAGRLIEWFTVGTPLGPVWTQILTTLGEAAAGFVIGAIAGAAAGILLGRTRFLADVCAPFVTAANAVPRIVLGSLFVILFGLGVSSKIATVVVMVFFAVFFEAFSSVQGLDSELIEQAYLFGATHRQAVTYIVVPIAKVRILAGLHHAFGLALIGALIGEYIGSERGLGLLINTAQAMFDVAGIIAGLILITVVALLVRLILSAVERRLVR